jgi:ribosomal protein L40E
MQDLTDSYCERCGAHHVFAVSTQKNLSLKNARVLAKGLRNFVLNDGQSMADSMTSARLEDSSSDSIRATEAFHQAFNFCLTCRQYACDNCWNAQAGACLTCAPRADRPTPVAGRRVSAPNPTPGWDPEWLNFTETTNGSVPAPDEPSLSGWPAGMLIGAATTTPAAPEVAPETASETAPAVTRVAASAPSPDHAAATESASWPAVDLPNTVPTAQGAAGRTGHAARKAPNPQAASIWPIADELAPEMTLTPEEMMLVQAELVPPEPAPAVPVTAEIVAAAETVAAAEPVRPPVVRRPVEEVLPVQPAPPEATRHAPAEPGGIVARLLGRRPAPDHAQEPGSTPTPETPVNRSGERWPHATPWIECPLDPGHRWVNQVAAQSSTANEPVPSTPSETFAETTAAAVSLTPDRELEVVAPPLERPAPATAPEFRKASRAAAQAEARMAASMRLTAVGPGEDLTDGSRIERRRAATPEPVAAEPVEATAQPVAWPPLGASWPAPNPGARKWAASDAPHPAVVAASQSPVPFETEMWAQSSQEVMNHGTVRVCQHCALPVSTQARFCRRCGTQQS